MLVTTTTTTPTTETTTNNNQKTQVALLTDCTGGASFSHVDACNVASSRGPHDWLHFISHLDSSVCNRHIANSSKGRTKTMDLGSFQRMIAANQMAKSRRTVH